MDRTPRLLAGVLVAVCGLAGGFLAYRLSRPAGSLHADNAVAVSSSGAAAPAATAHAVPDTIPDVRLPDLAGQSHSLRDYLGGPLIVNFWATWCEPCRREMPLLSQLQTREGAQLHIVGVAVDFASAVKEYLQKNAVSYPILVGEDAGLAAAQQFGMEPVLPFSVFADAQGRIVTVKVGELHRDDADAILTALRALAAGSETMPQARARIDAQLQALAVARSRSAATAAP